MIAKIEIGLELVFRVIFAGLGCGDADASADQLLHDALAGHDHFVCSIELLSEQVRYAKQGRIARAIQLIYRALDNTNKVYKPI